MILKVCGISVLDNQQALDTKNIDMIGYNFYPPSKRYITSKTAKSLSLKLDKSVTKVGVFVNEKMDTIRRIIDEVELDYVQLHGDETDSFVIQLASQLPVIKAFGIEKKEDLNIRGYESCTYFLLDTKTPLFGGSGEQFNWNMLDYYSQKTPFLLSGGIGPEDLSSIKNLKHNGFKGIDINSKFEVSPGIKIASSVNSFSQQLKN